MLNPKTEESRQAALDLLKPSPNDLEHGLELHANSLVIESYGLVPRASLDGDALKVAIDGGAPATEVREMMEQMYMARMVTDAHDRAEYAETWEDTRKIIGGNVLRVARAVFSG